MPVFFHESLPLLVETAMSNGVVFNESATVVRDGTGRLLLAIAGDKPSPNLEAELRTVLGNYVGTIGVVTGTPAAQLLKDRSVRQVPVDTASGRVSVRFADRRIVGVDWLNEPAAPSNGPLRLVFGSLKGGVGRSTALVVLAAELARRGMKVLAIDLDLEAPGIGTMLLPASDDPSQDRRPKYGAVDYLVENGINGVPNELLYDFVGVSPFHQGSIDVIPAVGRETDSRPQLMIAKLARAMVEDHSNGQMIPLISQVRQMVERFESQKDYDCILIDARAGMAEITAAPLIGLGAELFLFGTDQPQTFRGYAFILSHLMANSSPNEGGNDWRERLTFVQSKAPASSRKRSSFRESLYELCADVLYDMEPKGSDPLEVFSPGINETGPGVPHDSTYIEYHPDYDGFDPLADDTQLDDEVYLGPFEAFISRVLETLNARDTAN